MNFSWKEWAIYVIFGTFRGDFTLERYKEDSILVFLFEKYFVR